LPTDDEPMDAGAGEVEAGGDEELALRVARIIESLRPVLEGLPDDSPE